jgi:hypothetical protein
MKKPSKKEWLSGSTRRTQIKTASNKNCFCGKIREWLRKKRHRQGEQIMRSEAYFWRTPQLRMMQRNAVYGLFTKPLKKGAPGQSTPFPEE